MYCINIIAVGKAKAGYLKSGADEYLKRLKPYAKIEMIELESASFNKNSRNTAKQKESIKILACLNNPVGKNIFLLDAAGPEYSSEEFADLLEGISGKATFIIGGALGITDEAKKKFQNKLALSKMTLPHEMARLMLLEQLYRAAAISTGKTYHY